MPVVSPRPVARVDRVTPVPPPAGTTPDRALATLGARLAERPYARRGAPSADRVIRVLLVEPQALVRAALRQLLRLASDVEVVGDVADGSAAEATLVQHPADIVLLGGGNGLDSMMSTVRQLAGHPAAPRVLLVSTLPEEDGLIEALDAGASGYLTTDAAESDVLDALRVLASGDVFVRPRVARLLAAHQRARTRSPRELHRAAFERLSQRERAVVERLAQGFAGVEIGRQLGISNKTVETYKERINEKLGLRHRTEYVRFALEIGLLHR